MNRNLKLVAFGVAVLVLLSGCARWKKQRAERRRETQRTAQIESTLYYPLGRSSDSVLRVDRSFPGSVAAGQEFAYTIRVENVSRMVVSDVIVDERAPANFTMSSSTPEATPIEGGSIWSFNLDRLGPGESRMITIRGAASGDISTSATVTYLIPVGMDVRVDEAAAEPAVPEPPEEDGGVAAAGGVADVITLLTDKEGPVQVGDRHEYLYELENQGQVELTNASVVLAMPDGMEFVGATGAPVNRLEDGRVEFVLGTIGVGQRKAVQFIVRTTQAGEFRVVTDTNADQLASAAREDEVTVFVER